MIIVVLIISLLVVLSVYGGNSSDSTAGSVLDMPSGYIEETTTDFIAPVDVPPVSVVDVYTPPPDVYTPPPAPVVDQPVVNPVPFVPESVFRDEMAELFRPPREVQSVRTFY